MCLILIVLAQSTNTKAQFIYEEIKNNKVLHI